MSITILKKFPPNFSDIEAAFDLEGKRPVFAWGPFIFSPHTEDLPKDLIIHETIHSIQQDELGPEKWWKKYIADPIFRLEQEIPAYHNQYVCFCHSENDRNKRVKFAHKLASNMSGDMYGNICSFGDALRYVMDGKV